MATELESDRGQPGEDDTLQYLIVHCYPRLRLRMLKELGRDFRRHFDAEDVIQEAFIAAYRTPAASRPHDPAAFYRWIERIALNDLVDAKRALLCKKRDIRRLARTESPRSARTSVLDLVQCIPVGSTPSRQLSRREATAAVLSCLARLSDEQRHVIRARFLDEQSVAEVAEAMGKTHGAVHALCYRSLRALRGHLDTISHYISQR